MSSHKTGCFFFRYMAVYEKFLIVQKIYCNLKIGDSNKASNTRYKGKEYCGEILQIEIEYVRV